MDLDLAFNLVNFSVLPAWLLLIFLPNWTLTRVAIHSNYLLFDLFVGAWIARDAKRRGFSHALLIPCLFFTFMAGPFGLLLYVLFRKVTGKGGWTLFEARSPANA